MEGEFATAAAAAAALTLLSSSTTRMTGASSSAPESVTHRFEQIEVASSPPFQPPHSSRWKYEYIDRVIKRRKQHGDDARRVIRVHAYRERMPHPGAAAAFAMNERGRKRGSTWLTLFATTVVVVAVAASAAAAMN
ncbi:unnamed protein product [Soboliphyme baturini]|uniref:Uncharacterized protein n=1 Tax=Soboliphyme baturini TaxID=241478 RepID=A0A183ISD5_9BILA|nr:unnamed protein product [Soboliphyme baturini]